MNLSGSLKRSEKAWKPSGPGDRVTGLGGGAFKEYIVMQAEKTVHVPDCLKDEDAISEPLACLLSAAMKLPIETLGDPVAVVGCGYMGLGMISLFRAMGYGKITAIDKRPEALENALRFGATEVFTPDTIPEEYIMTFDTMGKVDLSRDGRQCPAFCHGLPYRHGIYRNAGRTAAGRRSGACAWTARHRRLS